ncbi:MAG: ATP-binding cassette domain-containing protein [Polyangiaceae bacterium]|nr:ATP-binding cassette domain-containing protein [Polyangiaceae bacterium]
MSEAFAPMCWPISRLGEALEAVATKSGLVPLPAELSRPPERATGGHDQELSRWVGAYATQLGLESEEVVARYVEVEGMLRALGPGLLLLKTEQGPELLACLPDRRGRVRLLAPDLGEHVLPASEVVGAICAEREAPLAPTIDAVLDAARVTGDRRARARRALLGESLAETPVGVAWILRPAPGRSFWRDVRLSGAFGKLATLAAAHAAGYVLFLLSWWMLGKGALEGRLDRGWLWAWALVLLTLVPFRLLETWTQGVLAIRVSRTLKQRLLAGALRIDADRIRHHGVGQLLGRVFESEAVEGLALGGGVATLVAIVELTLAAVVLGLGAGGLLHALLLVAWCATIALLARRYYARLQRWTNERRDLTSDLVERMIGHRTRLAQQRRADWHTGEDQALARYADVSSETDRTMVLLYAIAPRGWLAVAILGLGPAFVTGSSGPAVAVALGGTLLAYRALATLTNGLGQLANAAVVWSQVAELYRAAERIPVAGDPMVSLAPSRRDDASPLIDARDLVFRYPSAPDPVLRSATLRIARGDRVLVEGPSGGGKSTLGAVLSGLRVPQAGLVLLDGADRHTLGEAGWRSRVVAAPQFHENHLLTGTVSFNLLMGRRWPPTASDFSDAEQLCTELGLGPVLARMPAGMGQMVGESGWQLSHGERSRLFIARALLQNPELVLLDESFASLDPATLERCLECVEKRAPTLFVIAHP